MSIIVPDYRNLKTIDEVLQFKKSDAYKSLTQKDRMKLGQMLGGMRKGGIRTQRVIDKQKLQKAMESIIQRKASRLVRAGMIPAMGQHFVYRIDEETNADGKVISRKNTLVTDPDEIELALNAIDVGGVSEDEKYYFVTTKEPDYKAIQMLLDRGFGKPKETVDVNATVTFSLRELAKKREALKAGDVEIIPPEEQ